MRLRIKFFHLSTFVLTAMLFSMCSSDEGVRPTDDTAISGRGLINPGGTAINLIGLSTQNELVFLTVNIHGTTETGSVLITGLRSGESIIAIDKTKYLYGLSSQNTIYRIDPVSGIARPLGSAFTPALTAPLVGFDVSPSDNVIRVQTAAENLRISSTNGQVIGTDPLWHISGLALNGIAYLPGVAGSKATLYGIDIAGQKIYKQAPAGTGAVTLVGSTGFIWRLEGGFDIASNGIGYTIQYGHGLGSGNGGSGVGGSDNLAQDDYRMHSINLKSGVATSLGRVRPMMGLTAQ